jgi:hypothetical protein
MAGSTPNLGLYLPGGGSTGTWTPDEVADVDPLNQNFQKIDTFAGTVGVQTSRNQQFYGPAGAISSVVGMKLGDEYQESDGNKTLWRYDGSNWLTNEGSHFVVRPTSVAGTGVTLNPDGSVSLAAATSASLNGVFTTRFREYELSWKLQRTTNIGEAIRLRAAGADNAGASAYASRKGQSTGVGYSEFTAATHLWDCGSGIPTASSTLFKNIRLQEVASADYTKIVQAQGMETDGGGNLSNLVSLVGEHRVPIAYDGFTMIAQTGTLTGKIRVIGII